MEFTTITIGCDPEIFGFDPNKKEVVSLVGMIGGSKDKPLPVPFGSLQEDNVAAEIGITPAKTKHDFSFNINAVMAQLKQKVEAKGLDLLISPSAILKDEYLLSEAALRFGCEPDLNAWTLEWNPPPKADNPNLRSCGGHVHVGFDSPDMEKQMLLVRSMDIHLGLPSLFMDTDTRRRELYGKAGACRPKEYGVEYRTLSNFWLQSDKLMHWVFDQTHKAIKFVEENHSFLRENELHEDIQNSINTGNSNSAKDILNYLGVSYA